MRVKIDITSIERPPTGGWTITAYVDEGDGSPYFTHRRYFDYTKREAVQLFKEEMRQEYGTPRKNPLTFKGRVVDPLTKYRLYYMDNDGQKRFVQKGLKYHEAVREAGRMEREYNTTVYYEPDPGFEKEFRGAHYWR